MTTNPQNILDYLGLLRHNLDINDMTTAECISTAALLHVAVELKLIREELANINKAGRIAVPSSGRLKTT